MEVFNKNRWYLQDHSDLTIMYEFPISGPIDSAENKAYYLSLLREILIIGETSGLLKIQHVDVPSEERVFVKILKQFLEYREDSIKEITKPHFPHYDFDTYRVTEEGWYFNRDFSVYDEFGQAINVVFSQKDLKEFFARFKSSGAAKGYMLKFYSYSPIEQELLRGDKLGFQFHLESQTNIWFPFGGFDHSHACRFNNNELARLNCYRLDAFMKGMNDLTKRYEGVFWKENLLEPSIANNFIDPEGINWQEFERQCQLYEYPPSEQDYITVNYEAHMHFHPNGPLIVHYFSTLDLDSPEYRNTYKAHRHKFAFSIPEDESFKSVNSLQIFSPWGVLLTTLRDLPVHDDKAGWDGKLDGQPAPVGTYNFIAEVECMNGAIERHFGQVHVRRPI